LRGNPIKEWIVFSLLWLALLVPVIRVTGTRGSVAPAVRETDAAAPERVVQALASIRYTGTPLFFSISQNGRCLLEVANPPAEGVEQTLALALAESRAELRLHARWPDRGRQVFEIRVHFDDEAERTAHFWAAESLDEIASFAW
jgi:hypothetical protein